MKPGFITKNSQTHSYECRKSSFRRIKNRFTLLLGANAAGTHKITPYIIHKLANPRCFLNNSEQVNGFVYASNPSAWMYLNNFRDWFLRYILCRSTKFL